MFALETVAFRYSTCSGRDRIRSRSTSYPIHHRAYERPAGQGLRDGEQSRDITYVGNVVEGNVLAMDAEGVGGEAFNVAAGQRTTLNELLRTL